MKKPKIILELNHKEARKYFLENDSYCNFDLPQYFYFEEVLEKLLNKIKNSDTESFFKSGKSPRDFEKVNHLLLSNKDGQLAWRPYELINPILYVGLVHHITKEANWNFIVDRFTQYMKTGICCESIPLKSESKYSNRAEQVRRWWENVEQSSIKMGLRYQYVYDADISDCYGSIYTHSISWALHTKKVSKAKRKPNQLLGNKIDWFIQGMRNGQTNGIPQGSSLMDFIAEMLLGHVDELLVERIKQAKIKVGDYSVIRYRDDYKIFTNSPDVGLRILKCLSEVLSEIGIKLNTNKTKINSDPILASIKEDKMDELFVPNKRKNLSKWLMQIYASIAKHPNSGKTTRQLGKFFDTLITLETKGRKLKYYEDPEVMISIVVNIAIKNPRCYNWCMAIVSNILTFCSKRKQTRIIKYIHKKFNLVPNTGLLDIWLHRISSKTKCNIKYDEPLTELVNESVSNIDIWNCEWVKADLKNILLKTSIVNRELYTDTSIRISKKEVDLFKNKYNI